MADLLEKFERFIRKHRLVSPNDAVLLAVSGGMDSMTMLDLFSRIREPWKLRLAAAHVQHGIRGRESELDEAFVGDACRRYGIPFVAVQTDAVRYSRMKKVSLETGARELRYAFLHSVLDRLSFDALAVAHHADDQAETILLNMVRGAGLRGLGGMLPIRGNIVRPLLFATRGEIESYVREQRLAFRTDQTNRDTRFRRNRMRWNVLAKLKRHFGEHVASSICRAGLAVSEAEEVLEHEASRRFKRVVTRPAPDEIALDIHPFLNYFRGIQKAILIQIFQTAPFIHEKPSFFELEQILWLVENGKSGAVLNLAGNVSVVKSGKQLVWKKKTKAETVYPVEIGRILELKEAGIRFSSAATAWEPGFDFSQSGPDTAFLDFDRLHPPLTLRFYKPGDWFIPLGMVGKKKLQDFFVDLKVPVYRRTQVPLFLSDNAIAWVVGLRPDERFKVTDRTTRVLKLETTRI